MGSSLNRNNSLCLKFFDVFVFYKPLLSSIYKSRMKIEQTSRTAEAAMTGGRLGPAVTLPQNIIARICQKNIISHKKVSVKNYYLSQNIICYKKVCVTKIAVRKYYLSQKSIFKKKYLSKNIISPQIIICHKL